MNYFVVPFNTTDEAISFMFPRNIITGDIAQTNITYKQVAALYTELYCEHYRSLNPSISINTVINNFTKPTDENEGHFHNKLAIIPFNDLSLVENMYDHLYDIASEDEKYRPSLISAYNLVLKDKAANIIDIMPLTNKEGGNYIINHVKAAMEKANG